MFCEQNSTRGQCAPGRITANVPGGWIKNVANMANVCDIMLSGKKKKKIEFRYSKNYVCFCGQASHSS